MKDLAIALTFTLLTGLVLDGSAEARLAGINGRATVGCGGFGCHGMSASPSAGVTITTVPPGPLPPGTGADVTVTVNGPAPTGTFNTGGFNMGVSRGSFAASPDSRLWSPREISHSTDGNNQRSWTVRWSPPGTIPTLCGYDFNVSGNAVNGDNLASDLDHWNSASLTVAVDRSGESVPPGGAFVRPAVGESYVFDNALASPTPTLVVGSITLDVRVTDDVGILSVVFDDEDISGSQRIGVANYAGVVGGENGFRRFWDVSFEPPGFHTVTATVTDCDGNQTTISTEIFVL